MSPPSQQPEQPLTAAQIDAWIHRASLKRRQLLLHGNGTEPSRSVRVQAFLEMATLCLDAIEETRMVSAQLREESEAARFQSAEILAEAARLLAQCTSKTESQLLDILRGAQSQQQKPA
jgi:hypothetical protein